MTGRQGLPRIPRAALPPSAADTRQARGRAKRDPPLGASPQQPCLQLGSAPQVLQVPRAARKEVPELRPGSRYPAQVRAQPSGPWYRGSWSARPKPVVVDAVANAGKGRAGGCGLRSHTADGKRWRVLEMGRGARGRGLRGAQRWWLWERLQFWHSSSDAGWLIPTVTVVPLLFSAALLGLHCTFPSLYSNMKQKLWPPVPDLHRALGSFLQESSKHGQVSGAFDEQPQEAVLPCLLEVLPGPRREAGSPPEHAGGRLSSTDIANQSYPLMSGWEPRPGCTSVATGPWAPCHAALLAAAQAGGGKSGSKIQSYPTKAGGDRYIPNRRTMQMEMANFLLTKENDPAEDSPTKKEQQKAWAVNLNGFDVEEAKILYLRGKPQNAPEGCQNNLKVLYSQKMASRFSRKKSRYIPSKPERVLDASEMFNDYYLNLIDWSSQKFLAVALDNTVYLWNYGTREIIPLLQTEHPDIYISSASWIKDGDYLAVGTSSAEVQLWDVEQQKHLRTMTSHCGRVGTLSWNSCILSSGAPGHIHHHDVRVAEHHVATLAGRTQEVCGLKWSLDGRYLARGGNDSLVNVWPCTQCGGGNFTPLQTFTQHQGAVKAVAWCPWQMNVLATGGGTSDRHVCIWNVCSGACLSAVDTRSQVTFILWSTNYKELISGHGFAQNQLVIWKYPRMNKVAELQGHTDRILNLTMSPDGTSVASGAADETVQVWSCFEMDPIKKKEKEKANSAKSGILHQSIC
ncbi:LOW QUALITY PROTEIN: cell division cycle protein 20 homolog [Passerculus sandwichensis]